MTANALTPPLLEFVELLVAARRSGRLLATLNPAHRPTALDDALGVQDAVTTALGETVGGWKVAIDKNGRAARGAMFASRIVASPARISSGQVPLLGVEIEVAFRFDRDLPPRTQPYSAEELAAFVTALPAIEVVDSRFADYRSAPNLDRIADHASFGLLITGQPEPLWRERDLSGAAAEIHADAEVLGTGRGNAKAGDPLLPALALANELRAEGVIKAGHIITTGTYTPLRFAKPGQRITASIQGLGNVSLDVLPD
jgi:2-keto-4-pentenoate hydratase